MIIKIHPTWVQRRYDAPAASGIMELRSKARKAAKSWASLQHFCRTQKVSEYVARRWAE